MASWMVHLRVADKLLDLIPDLSPVEFIVGNLAPDSGIPNDDAVTFTPDTSVSHFRTEGIKACPEAFAETYFTSDRQSGYDEAAYSFYLGYLTHLITDVLWSQQVAVPTFRALIGGDPPYTGDLVSKVKDDWYDLDRKYLRDRPGFRALRAYLGAVGFRNRFMTEFSEDAFDNRRQYITDFYLQPKEGLDREYPYLTEPQMNAFVDGSVREISDILHRNYGVKL